MRRDEEGFPSKALRSEKGAVSLRWWKAGEKGKTMQHYAIFCNRKNAKRLEPTNTGRESGLNFKGMASGSFNPPCPL